MKLLVACCVALWLSSLVADVGDGRDWWVVADCAVIAVNLWAGTTRAATAGREG